MAWELPHFGLRRTWEIHMMHPTALCFGHCLITKLVAFCYALTKSRSSPVHKVNFSWNYPNCLGWLFNYVKYWLMYWICHGKKFFQLSLKSMVTLLKSILKSKNSLRWFMSNAWIELNLLPCKYILIPKYMHT